jgi:hypothetical protein
LKGVITYVGIDAHKKDLFVAMLSGHEKTPVTWQLANEPNALRRLVRTLEREAPGPARVFYEAGPCGYALRRQLTTPWTSCDVVAPALIPRRAQQPLGRGSMAARPANTAVELPRHLLEHAVDQRADRPERMIRGTRCSGDT